MNVRSMMSLLSFVLLAAMPAAASASARAQEPAAEPAAEVTKQLGPADIIMPHITDSRGVEYPCFKSLSEWACEAEFPTWHIAGKDITITKHVFFLMVAALLTLALLLGVASSHRRHSAQIGRPKGFGAGMEAVILYLRNEIYMPVLGGHGGEKYVPFRLTLFFFIMMCNLIGLVPWGSTPTGNIAVTATLAVITFVVVEVAGMRALGAGYLGTIIYWPHDMSLPMKLGLTIILTPVELVGKFTKPFALTIRLFANMMAGHVIVLALIGLIFMFGFGVALGSIPMALFIMGLEIMVAFIQAFIFSLLAAVFIGQIRSAHH
jgi:F-type H+-transporting ATPase subunit a